MCRRLVCLAAFAAVWALPVRVSAQHPYGTEPASVQALRHTFALDTLTFLDARAFNLPRRAMIESVEAITDSTTAGIDTMEVRLYSGEGVSVTLVGVARTRGAYAQYLPVPSDISTAGDRWITLAVTPSPGSTFHGRASLWITYKEMFE